MRRTQNASDPAKAYVGRLVKLIPAEVVAVYLAGAGAIKAAFHPDQTSPAYYASEQAYWWGWTIFCFIAVILVRTWATSSKPENLAPEWPAIIIAAISFLIWVYSLGDAFALAGLWEPLLATLLVLAWTFLIPLIYIDKHAENDVTAVSRARTASAGFSEADSEQAVLDSAQWLTNHRPSLMQIVSDTFDNTNRVRRLLGRTQDHIFEEHGHWVELADGSEADMTERGKGTFGDLASWVLDKVKATSVVRPE